MTMSLRKAIFGKIEKYDNADLEGKAPCPDAWEDAAKVYFQNAIERIWKGER